mgnify:CR=1 FL=1
MRAMKSVAPAPIGPRTAATWAAFCLLMLLAGFPMALDLVRGWAPQAWVDAFAGLSFLTHFQAISRGVLDLRDVVFFLLCIAAWLAATVLVIDLKKAD